jgi:hypothetical protein
MGRGNLPSARPKPFCLRIYEGYAHLKVTRSGALNPKIKKTLTAFGGAANENDCMDVRPHAESGGANEGAEDLG